MRDAHLRAAFRNANKSKKYYLSHRVLRQNPNKKERHRHHHELLRTPPRESEETEEKESRRQVVVRLLLIRMESLNEERVVPVQSDLFQSGPLRIDVIDRARVTSGKLATWKVAENLKRERGVVLSVDEIVQSLEEGGFIFSAF